jgi:hypothetical protein
MADQSNSGNSGEPPKITTPADALDFESLWLNPSLGDGIVDVSYHRIAVGKPKDFFPHPPGQRLLRTKSRSRGKTSPAPWTCNLTTGSGRQVL